ncbi:glycosyltransferase family 4 protein [Phaffia rhodozyma]|uniref:Alpha-1,3/1,6-mannosyltransferase ALG2 n=1 Tax=Phaffia rhodozyma TaxID=264483 RepID=A0A0F7SF03_PHARH|nr:glycosyltransferase family 4 protein [Phaffia rhodozyma]
MSSQTPINPPDKNATGLPSMRIGFIHPDLGIGGAERLVVDAATSLQDRGHSVEIFTSRHDPTRCFDETRDGTLKVHVLGNTLPRSIFNSLHIIFAILRQLHLTLLLLLSLLPIPVSLQPIPELRAFDVFFVDQLSICVPLLRYFLRTRVVFYCHFPDKLLSGEWDLTPGEEGPRKKESTGLRSLIKSCYRLPLDLLEEFTTCQADVILANSIYTSKVCLKAFSSLKQLPRVVYPTIDTSAFTPLTPKQENSSDAQMVLSDRPTLVSLNRFEGKKNAALAIEAFARLTKEGLVDDQTFSNLRLVLAGGYDTSVQDNVQTLNNLKALCVSYSLTYHVVSELTLKPPPVETQVLFVLNFSNIQRTALLLSPSTRAFLYTPSNEHFGIGPIEAMACKLPVLAVNSGGPTETVVDLADASQGETGTGLLRPAEGAQWAKALAKLVLMKPAERKLLGESGSKRTKELFDIKGMGFRLEEACRQAEEMGPVSNLAWIGAASLGVLFAAWALS